MRARGKIGMGDEQLQDRLMLDGVASLPLHYHPTLRGHLRHHLMRRRTRPLLATNDSRETNSQAKFQRRGGIHLEQNHPPLPFHLQSSRGHSLQRDSHVPSFLLAILVLQYQATLLLQSSHQILQSMLHLLFMDDPHALRGASPGALWLRWGIGHLDERVAFFRSDRLLLNTIRCQHPFRQ